MSKRKPAVPETEFQRKMMTGVMQRLGRRPTSGISCIHRSPDDDRFTVTLRSVARHTLDAQDALQRFLDTAASFGFYLESDTIEPSE